MFARSTLGFSAVASIVRRCGQVAENPFVHVGTGAGTRHIRKVLVCGPQHAMLRGLSPFAAACACDAVDAPRMNYCLAEYATLELLRSDARAYVTVFPALGIQQMMERCSVWVPLMRLACCTDVLAAALAVDPGAYAHLSAAHQNVPALAALVAAKDSHYGLLPPAMRCSRAVLCGMALRNSPVLLGGQVPESVFVSKGLLLCVIEAINPRLPGADELLAHFAGRSAPAVRADIGFVERAAACTPAALAWLPAMRSPDFRRLDRIVARCVDRFPACYTHVARAPYYKLDAQLARAALRLPSNFCLVDARILDAASVRAAIAWHPGNLFGDNTLHYMCRQAKDNPRGRMLGSRKAAVALAEHAANVIAALADARVRPIRPADARLIHDMVQGMRGFGLLSWPVVRRLLRSRARSAAIDAVPPAVLAMCLRRVLRQSCGSCVLRVLAFT